MSMFHVVLLRSGPDWRPDRRLEEQSGWPEHAAFMDGLVAAGFVVLGGPLVDEHRVVHAVQADSEAAVRATLARDPWSGTHLEIDSIEPWTIRLDARSIDAAVRAAAARWRDVWQRAWPVKDADAIVALYAADAVYRSHPFREPESSVRDYVERCFAEEDAVACAFGEPVVTGNRAAVEWWASWREDGAELTLAGTTVLRFAGDGLVREHIDYWVQDDGRRAPPAGWGTP